MKRRTKILGGLVVVVAAVVLAIIFHTGSSRREVEAYKRQLRAQGENLTVSELIPAPPAEFFEGARDFMNAMIPSRSISNYPPAMKMMGPGVAMVAWQQDVLARPEDKMSNIWPGLSLELEANRAALSNLQTVLDAPGLYFNLDYSQGWSLLLPHLARLKQAELLASVSTLAALHEKNFSGAWTNLHAAVTLVRRYETEPLLISHLVRIAMAQIAFSATWEFLQSGQSTDAQLAELQSEWEAVEFLNSSEAAFVMERAMAVETLRLARKSRDEVMKMYGPGPTASSAGFFDDPEQALKDIYERYRYQTWKSSWSYEEELCLLQQHDATVRAIRRTELSGAFAPALKELNGSLAEINKLHANASKHFLFVGQSGDEWRGKSLLKLADTEVGRRVLVTAIALKRYQLQHAKYPADLNALVPALLPQTPVDLMDGQPLRYHTKPDGNFLLYSVGEDGEDNGGDATGAEAAQADVENMRFKSWLKGRDIVWPRPATAEEIAAYYKKNPTAVAQTFPARLRVPMQGPKPVVVTRETNAPAGTNGAAR